MGRLVVSVLTSLDGFFEGLDGDLSPMPFEDAFNTHNLELLRRADALVYGSTWFTNNWTTWSAVANDPDSGEREQETAALVTSLRSIVVSDSFEIAADDAWSSTATVVRRDDAPAEIARLKDELDGDLVMFGSATTWNPLLEAGLVDELVVLVGAALVGDGAKLYTGAPAALTLVDARVLPDSQLVALRYRA